MKQMREYIDRIQSDRRFLFVQARDDKQQVLDIKKQIKALNNELEETKKKLQEAEKNAKEVKLRVLREAIYGESIY